MNNKMVKTDSLWYKIKNFFRNLIHIKNKKEESEKQNISVIPENKETQLEEQKRKITLVNQLLNGEIHYDDLEVDELDEMIEYFKKDIKQQDIELERIKRHILEMKKVL